MRLSIACLLAINLPALALVAACTSDRLPPKEAPKPPAVANTVMKPSSDLDTRFVAAIRSAAAPYQTWGRVELEPNLAPLDCAMPAPLSQGAVHMSQAEAAPHGKKLYYLWASDRASYLAIPNKQRPIANGFAIVKESFAAVRGTKPKGAAFGTVLHSTIRVGDEWLTTGEAKGLYVMTKVGVGEGTDAGWIYGTIEAGEVTSAGRVASCMRCHDAGTHDRLFGPKRDEIHE